MVSLFTFAFLFGLELAAAVLGQTTGLVALLGCFAPSPIVWVGLLPPLLFAAFVYEPRPVPYGSAWTPCQTLLALAGLPLLGYALLFAESQTTPIGLAALAAAVQLTGTSSPWMAKPAWLTPCTLSFLALLLCLLPLCRASSGLGWLPAPSGLWALSPFARLSKDAGLAPRVIAASNVFSHLVPYLGYLVPGQPGFPKGSESTALAVRPADPLRSHAGLLCAANYLASLFLLSAPAAIGLMGSGLDRLKTSKPKSENLVMHFPQHAVLFALVVLCMFDRLGIHLAYHLSPTGKVRIRVLKAQMEALQTHYTLATGEVFGGSLLGKLRKTQVNRRFAQAMRRWKVPRPVLKHFRVGPAGPRSR